MQEMSRKRDANKTYVSRERSIERKMCQQTRMSRGQRCRVVETQRDREREKERERERDQKKELSGKRTVEEKQRCLACTKSVYWNTACKMSRPHSQGPRGKQPPTGNSRLQALLVEIHLLAATLSSFRKQPFVEQKNMTPARQVWYSRISAQCCR